MIGREALAGGVVLARPRALVQDQVSWVVASDAAIGIGPNEITPRTGGLVLLCGACASRPCTAPLASPSLSSWSGPLQRAPNRGAVTTLNATYGRFALT